MVDIAFSAAIGKKLATILPELDRKFIEREEVIRIIVLTIMTKCNAFLIGKPGTGKSYLLNRICSFVDNYAWYEKMFSSETQEKHVFGPERVENDGSVVYLTRGMLPEANFAFGDEVFKSSKELQDSMLQVINEKKFKNGADVLDVPLFSFFGASNEFAKQAESPFFDRLHFKYQVLDFQDDESFDAYMDKAFDESDYISEKIALSDIETIQQISETIVTPRPVKETRSALRKAFQSFGIDVSPRTWGVIAHIWRVSACLNGRSEIDYSDILLSKYVCWSSYKQREEAEKINYSVVFGEKSIAEHEIEDTRNKMDSVVSSVKKDFVEILSYGVELRGPGGETAFYEAKKRLSALLQDMKQIDATLTQLGDKAMSNVEVTEQIKKNIFLIDMDDPVFSPDMVAEIVRLKSIIDEYIPNIDQWLRANANIIDYQSAWFEKNS